MMDGLRECPFCGGEAEIVVRLYEEYTPVMDKNYMAQCMSCLSMTAPRISEDATRAAWNWREGK